MDLTRARRLLDNSNQAQRKYRAKRRSKLLLARTIETAIKAHCSRLERIDLELGSGLSNSQGQVLSAPESSEKLERSQ
jgi:hypothetical protein